MSEGVLNRIRRAVRYVVRGSVDTDEVDVVCRFRSDGTLLIIITVYVVN